MLFEQAADQFIHLFLDYVISAFFKQNPQGEVSSNCLILIPPICLLSFLKAFFTYHMLDPAGVLLCNFF